MAAKRNGIKTVIIPRENEKDLDEIDQTVRSSLQFVLVDHVDQVLAQALLSGGSKAGEDHSRESVNRCENRSSARLTQ